MEIINCKDCAWFSPIESMTEAEKLHNELHDLFDDILPVRDGDCGICRKVTFSKDRPVLTNENGYCHRAESK